MRTKRMAVLISSLACVALLGCNTEAGYREDDAARPESQTSDTQQYETPGGLGAWSEWDADASGDVTKTEFDSTFASAPVWSDWDTNGDQALDQSEAANVSWLQGKDWKEWDTDSDGRLARNESAEALWTMWDSNGDHKLELSEWKA